MTITHFTQDQIENATKALVLEYKELGQIPTVDRFSKMLQTFGTKMSLTSIKKLYETFSIISDVIATQSEIISSLKADCSRMTGEAVRAEIARLQILQKVKLSTLTEVLLHKYDLIQTSQSKPSEPKFILHPLVGLIGETIDTDYVLVYEDQPLGLPELVWQMGDQFITPNETERSQTLECSEIIKQRFLTLVDDRLTSLLTYQNSLDVKAIVVQ